VVEDSTEFGSSYLDVLGGAAVAPTSTPAPTAAPAPAPS
jgi:hypothetical protein